MCVGGGDVCVWIVWVVKYVITTKKTSRKVWLGSKFCNRGEFYMRSFHKPIHLYTRKIVMILRLPVCN